MVDDNEMHDEHKEDVQEDHDAPESAESNEVKDQPEVWRHPIPEGLTVEDRELPKVKVER